MKIISIHIIYTDRNVELDRFPTSGPIASIETRGVSKDNYAAIIVFNLFNDIVKLKELNLGGYLC